MLIGWGPGLLVINIIGNYCCTHVLLYAKMLNETGNQETRLFCRIFIIGGISIGGTLAPSYAYNFNFNAISDIKVLCAFLPLCACQSHTNRSIFFLYDHAKYCSKYVTILVLVKVKIVKQ